MSNFNISNLLSYHQSCIFIETAQLQITLRYCAYLVSTQRNDQVGPVINQVAGTQINVPREIEKRKEGKWKGFWGTSALFYIALFILIL